MYTRLKNLFAIKGYSLFVICMLLIGIGFSITAPYLSLYCTEDLGMSAGAFGVFMAVSSLSGVVVNSLIAKRSDSGLDRKWIIISAALSSALGYASYLVFHNFFILLMVVSFFNGLGAAAIPQIYAYAQESANASKSDDKTFAMSTLRSLISLGFLVGPLGGTLILGAVGYKGLFLGIRHLSYHCIFCIPVSAKTKSGSKQYQEEKKYRYLFAQKQADQAAAYRLYLSVCGQCH